MNQWDEETELGGINDTTGEKDAGLTGQMRSKNYITCAPNTTYYVKAGSNVFALFGYCYDENKNFIGRIYVNPSDLPDRIQNKVITTLEGSHFMMFKFRYSDYGTTYNHDISINYPSTDTAYHAYEGTTYSVDLSSAGTVYGGTLDVTTGVLTVTKARIDLNGSSSENWQEYSVAQGELHRIISVPRKDGTIPQVSVISDCYRTVSQYESRSENTISGTGTLIDIIDSGYATLTEWKAHIAESPIELVYELATPQTYQLTPTEVTTLLKNNTLTANCGTVSLSYYADTKSYIDNAIATAISSL